MATRVNIEASAWGDKRFALLAKYLGFADSDHALIKCAVLWAWQTESYTPERPTYVVDGDTIDACLGRDGAGAALVKARLAEEDPDGFRIRGSEGRIEWLWQCKVNAQRGVEARRARADLDHDRPVDHPVNPSVDCCSDAHIGQPTGQPGGEPRGAPTPQPNPQPSLLLVPEEEEKRSASRKNGSQARHPPGTAAGLVAHWIRRFEDRRGYKPAAREVRRVVDSLLKDYSPALIRQHMDNSFDRPPDWPKGPHDIGVIQKHFHKFAGPEVRAGPTGPRPILSREQRDRERSAQINDDEPEEFEETA